MVQEAYDEHPAIRDACARAITGHAATIETDVAAALELHGITADWTAESLALHTQAVLQGAFILAKATNDVSVAAESVRHLRRYVELLFSVPQKTEIAT
jgi:TetR/AcrR family transcriptional repressor of nem operon